MAQRTECARRGPRAVTRLHGIRGDAADAGPSRAVSCTGVPRPGLVVTLLRLCSRDQRESASRSRLTTRRTPCHHVRARCATRPCRAVPRSEVALPCVVRRSRVVGARGQLDLPATDADGRGEPQRNRHREGEAACRRRVADECRAKPFRVERGVVSPEGIEAWVRRSANRLTAHDFWLQVVDSQWVSHYSAFDGRSRPSTRIYRVLGDILETGERRTLGSCPLAAQLCIATPR